MKDEEIIKHLEALRRDLARLAESGTQTRPAGEHEEESYSQRAVRAWHEFATMAPKVLEASSSPTAILIFIRSLIPRTDELLTHLRTVDPTYLVWIEDETTYQLAQILSQFFEKFNPYIPVISQKIQSLVAFFQKIESIGGLFQSKDVRAHNKTLFDAYKASIESPALARFFLTQRAILIAHMENYEINILRMRRNAIAYWKDGARELKKAIDVAIQGLKKMPEETASEAEILLFIEEKETFMSVLSTESLIEWLGNTFHLYSTMPMRISSYVEEEQMKTCIAVAAAEAARAPIDLTLEELIAGEASHAQVIERWRDFHEHPAFLRAPYEAEFTILCGECGATRRELEKQITDLRTRCAQLTQAGQDAALAEAEARVAELVPRKAAADAFKVGLAAKTQAVDAMPLFDATTLEAHIAHRRTRLENERKYLKDFKAQKGDFGTNYTEKKRLFAMLAPLSTDSIRKLVHALPDHYSIYPAQPALKKLSPIIKVKLGLIESELSVLTMTDVDVIPAGDEGTLNQLHRDYIIARNRNTAKEALKSETLEANLTLVDSAQARACVAILRTQFRLKPAIVFLRTTLGDWQAQLHSTQDHIKQLMAWEAQLSALSPLGGAEAAGADAAVQSIAAPVVSSTELLQQANEALASIDDLWSAVPEELTAPAIATRVQQLRLEREHLAAAVVSAHAHQSEIVALQVALKMHRESLMAEECTSLHLKIVKSSLNRSEKDTLDFLKRIETQLSKMPSDVDELSPLAVVIAQLCEKQKELGVSLRRRQVVQSFFGHDADQGLFQTYLTARNNRLRYIIFDFFDRFFRAIQNLVQPAYRHDTDRALRTNYIAQLKNETEAYIASGDNGALSKLCKQVTQFKPRKERKDSLQCKVGLFFQRMQEVTDNPVSEHIAAP